MRGGLRRNRERQTNRCHRSALPYFGSNCTAICLSLRILLQAFKDLDALIEKVGMICSNLSVTFSGSLAQCRGGEGGEGGGGGGGGGGRMRLTRVMACASVLLYCFPSG